MERKDTLRRLEPHWNHGMIAASIAISLLGAFTSTQLMCQARLSVRFPSVLAWTFLASLTFGFCSIWSLHFVAMLACELDLPIGINVPLTLLSAVLAVFFTFAALASDILYDKYRGRRQKRKSVHKAESFLDTTRPEIISKPLLSPQDDEDEGYSDYPEDAGGPPHQSDEVSLPDSDNRPGSPFVSIHPSCESISTQRTLALPLDNSPTKVYKKMSAQSPDLDPSSPRSGLSESPAAFTEPFQTTSSEYSNSRRSSSFAGSSHSSYGLGNIINLAYRGTSPAKNAFIATGEAIYVGFTRKNIIKGLLWSLAITSMHYVGVAALRIPNGHITLNVYLVILSAFISWVVCLIGRISMSRMETHFTQQVLFSIIAATGVAGMHFTGMGATTFWSAAAPSDRRGYPPALAVATVSIAIVTCIGANGLLAHVATVSRNKLAEIVWTRRKLWRTMAQKENAEAAAAARSDFIASASHEIRTPLHHLQGYSDLLSRTELSEESRMLLYAIQSATKTLSMITNNVLDWSKLERDSENNCRPILLDMRTVCESILVLLPNKDDEADVELMVVVTPEVPRSLLLDETYIHRILMNLLSNAIKFTRSGYILLLIEMNENKLTATVKDTGTGIPQSFLPQLFEPFKQATTRGSQRGTGLGMSIIVQLLHKMQGTIEVESRHPETRGIQPGESGSTFTIKIPTEVSITPQHELQQVMTRPRIAIFEGKNERAVEGLCTAWEKFGFEVVSAKETSDLVGSQWEYIWADLQFLDQNPNHLRDLLESGNWLVLVPYDMQDALEQYPGLKAAPNFIPLQKPLIWHTIQQRVTAAKQRRSNGEVTRTVRFASKVDIVDHGEKKLCDDERTAKSFTVLLVEDNPINQKLGKKMLTSLHYRVLLAENGEEAIEQIRKHDDTVDIILMDQSMPFKDGLTATREIRDLEASGVLSKKRPIVALTAVVNGESQALFKSAGADDFLAKPLTLNKLEQTLAAHLPTR